MNPLLLSVFALSAAAADHIPTALDAESAPKDPKLEPGARSIPVVEPPRATKKYRRTVKHKGTFTPSLSPGRAARRKAEKDFTARFLRGMRTSTPNTNQ